MYNIPCENVIVQMHACVFVVLVKAAPVSVSAKVKNRLEEIEDFEEV